MMADETDDCRDVVRYWQTLNEGWECVFGSRFIAGRRRDRLSARQAACSTALVELVHPAAVPDSAERHDQRLQGLPARPRSRAAGRSSRRIST